MGDFDALPPRNDIAINAAMGFPELPRLRRSTCCRVHTAERHRHRPGPQRRPRPGSPLPDPGRHKGRTPGGPGGGHRRPPFRAAHRGRDGTRRVPGPSTRAAAARPPPPPTSETGEVAGLVPAFGPGEAGRRPSESTTTSSCATSPPRAPTRGSAPKASRASGGGVRGAPARPRGTASTPSSPSTTSMGWTCG